MDRTFLYGVMGLFSATLFSLFLRNYQPNPFLLILLPMWGLIMGVAIARVVARSAVGDQGEVEDIILYQKLPKKLPMRKQFQKGGSKRKL